MEEGTSKKNISFCKTERLVLLFWNISFCGLYNVNIEAQINEKRLKFVISDHGTPFDPTEKEDADVTLSVEERPIGGLGIYLVRQIMDSVNYERLDGMNVLTLRKFLKTQNNE